MRHIAPEMLGLLLVEAGLSFSLGWLLLARAAERAIDNNSAVQNGLVIAGAVGFTSFLLGAYRPSGYAQIRSLVTTTALGGLLAFPVVWGVTWLLGLNPDGFVGLDPIWPTKIFVAWIGALLTIRLAFQSVVQLRLFTRRIGVAGGLGAATGTVAAIRADRAGLFEVLGLSGTGPLNPRSVGIRTILVPHSIAPPVSEDAGIEVLGEAAFWERHLRRVDVEHLTQEWVAALGDMPRHWAWVWFHRAADIVTSLVILVFTLPLMLLVAVLVRLDSPGPVLYRQERVGKDAVPFVLLKFRSMNNNAEARGPAWAQQQDPRVTRVGSVMRRTRIDELPQLINVLRGEMSLIGPRPERPHFVEQLAAVIPFYRERARVKPGLTGWAQVNFPYGASVEDARAKLSYDLYYVKNHSPILDLMILFATVRVILFQEGAR